MCDYKRDLDTARLWSSGRHFRTAYSYLDSPGKVLQMGSIEAKSNSRLNNISMLTRPSIFSHSVRSNIHSRGRAALDGASDEPPL